MEKPKVLLLKIKDKPSLILLVQMILILRVPARVWILDKVWTTDKVWISIVKVRTDRVWSTDKAKNIVKAKTGDSAMLVR